MGFRHRDRADRALVVSGGCLIRDPSRQALLESSREACDSNGSSVARPEALLLLRSAVDQWIHAGDASQTKIICADRGFDHARALGLKPDIIVGDLDSMSTEGQAMSQAVECRLDVHPPDKDASDTELAVMHALSMGASELLIIGALGGRTDHELANIMLIAGLAQQGLQAEILDNACRMHAIAASGTLTEICIQGSPGDLLTLVPVSRECVGVSLWGLEYPLSEATLALGTSRGVSNVFVEPEATIAIRNGTLLIVVTFAQAGSEAF